MKGKIDQAKFTAEYRQGSCIITASDGLTAFLLDLEDEVYDPTLMRARKAKFVASELDGYLILHKLSSEKAITLQLEDVQVIETNNKRIY